VKFDETFGKDHADSFLLFETGRADAFVMDGQILAGLIATSRMVDSFRIIGSPLAVEPIAIMFRKDDPAMKKIVNTTIEGLFNRGEIRQIYSKWFMEAIPPGNIKLNLPASASTVSAWTNPTDRPAEDYVGK
jgi:glutamate/aspartate transport system substrate-binding protein